MANLLLLDNMIPMLAEIPAGNLMAPESNSTFASWVDLTRLIIDLITLVFFVAIIAVMVYFALKFRRTDDRAHAEHTAHHNTALELSWTIPPLFIVLILFYMGFVGYWEQATPPTDAYEIQVTAKKWSWEFVHPNGYTSSVLDVPAGQPVKLIMRSEDVLHSLYVPAFRVKKDVVPGRYTSMWFEAVAPTPLADHEMPTGDELTVQAEAELKNQVTAEEFATQWAEIQSLDPKKAESRKRAIMQRKFDAIAEANGHILFCTEFCGNDHSNMLAKVVVHKSDWQAPPFGEGLTPIQLGKKLFEIKGCDSCHADEEGEQSPCPPLFAGILNTQRQTNVGAVTADENYLRESILNPGAKIVNGYGNVMPVIKISDEHVDAIIAYMKTLGAEPADETGTNDQGGDNTSGQTEATE